MKTANVGVFRRIALFSALSQTLLLPFCGYAEERGQISVEQVDKAVREVEKAAQTHIREGAVPSLAIAVVWRDKVVYAKGFGVRDMKAKEPVDGDTVFQLASVQADWRYGGGGVGG